MQVWATLLGVFFFISIAGAEGHRQASQCELVIRELRLPKVNSWGYHHLDIILQIDMTRLDSPVKNLGFMNQDGQIHNDFVIDRYGNQAKLFIVSPETDDLNGAFFLVTERETWYWLNKDGKPFSNFSLSGNEWQTLKEKAEWRFGFSESYAVVDLTSGAHPTLSNKFNPFRCHYD